VQKLNSSRPSKSPSILHAPPNPPAKPPFLEALQIPLLPWVPPFFFIFSPFFSFSPAAPFVHLEHGPCELAGRDFARSRRPPPAHALKLVVLAGGRLLQQARPRGRRWRTGAACAPRSEVEAALAARLASPALLLALLSTRGRHYLGREEQPRGSELRRVLAPLATSSSAASSDGRGGAEASGGRGAGEEGGAGGGGG
jgi:hypothetical protein